MSVTCATGRCCRPGRVLAEDAAAGPLYSSWERMRWALSVIPDFKTAMAEDLIMEFEESPDNPAPQLERLQLMSKEIEDALVPIMTGIIKVTGLMQKRQTAFH